MLKKIMWFIIICIFVALIIGIIMFNKWIQGEVGDIMENPITTSTIEPLPVPIQKEGKPKKRRGEVIKKTRLGPERSFSTSIFYQDGEEIARHKESLKGVIYDQSGEIPNGKVKFINESNETFGVEYYQDGGRHGPLRINYKDGPLKQEAYYEFGKLITRKEFYYDGIVRMEEDYSDARDYQDKRDVGIGKVYFRDGKIKYEWYLTNSNPVGYNKSYNHKGRLTSTIYYDRNGDIVPSREESAVQKTVPNSD